MGWGLGLVLLLLLPRFCFRTQRVMPSKVSCYRVVFSWLAYCLSDPQDFGIVCFVSGWLAPLGS
jgi:hypothetical protein